MPRFKLNIEFHPSLRLQNNMYSLTSNWIKIAPTVVNAEYSFKVERRTANYKPNIWKYDHLQSLPCKYAEEKYKRKTEKLQEDVSSMFLSSTDDSTHKLQLIDSIQKLGLSYYFEDQIKEALEDTMAFANISFERDLYATSLCFRILRHYGYTVSQDMFSNFVDETGKFRTSRDSSVRGMWELFNAANMGSEEECILQQARLFSTKHLRGLDNDTNPNSKLVSIKQNYDVLNLSLPLHWEVEWYNIKKQIYATENQHKTNSELIELAKLNFNIVQAAHQGDLKQLSRWWINQGITEKLSFSRDRMVESFMFAGGVAFEPQYTNLRKWMSKIIKLILVIDDLYDVYGSLEELECFTKAIDRWKPDGIEELPECMKICFWTLFNTTEEIAVEIQKEKGWNSVLPYLQNKWADFCRSLLLEAKWYNKGYTPSLTEYLDNGWISSSGPLLSLVVILGTTKETTKDVSELLKDNADLTYCTSLIIRLCNDQGTSAAELARGDGPSSILCYMRESNVSEETARDYIRSLISRTWRKINGLCIDGDGDGGTKISEEPTKYIINTARVANFIYQNGDGFGVQDGEYREHVLSTLMEPFTLPEDAGRLK